MPHRYALPLTVRYADTDAQGHVFFANYLTYCDEGLTGYLAEIGCPYRDLEALDLDLVYAATRCEHRGSARFGDVLLVRTAITRLGTTSLTVSARVRREGELVAEASLTSVCVSRSDHSPQPIPERLREAVRRYESCSDPTEEGGAGPGRR